MADEAQRTPGTDGAGRLRERLYGRLLLLLAIGLVFLTLAGTQQLSGLMAFLAYGVVVLVALFVPETAEPREGGVAGTDMSDHVYADAVRHFADALPDPCIVIDRRSIIVHLNAPVRQQFPGVVNGSPIAYSLRFPALLSAIEAA